MQPLKTITILILNLFVFNILAAQNPRCTRTTCGTVQAVWALADGEEAIICEGDDFRLTGIESTPLDNIDDFHWYFIEVTTGEILFEQLIEGTSPVTYRYEINDSLACVSESSIELDVILIVSSPDCVEGESCGWKGGSVIVKLQPRAIFEKPNSACVDQEVTFINKSCHGDEFLWEFGDGTTSTEKNPSHIYKNTGTYTVKLTVNNGCATDVTTQTISVVGLPEAKFDFSASKPEHCPPVTIQFSNESNQWSNTRWEIHPMDTLLWCFTDTNMSTASRNIEVLFKQEGSYEFTLVANNTCNEPDEQMEVVEIFKAPAINLTTPPVFCEPTSIRPEVLNFSFSGTITEFIWTINNGQEFSFSGETFPPTLFEQSGSIQLTVSGPCGSQSKTVPISIANSEMISVMNEKEICQNFDTIRLNAMPTGGVWRGKGIANMAITPDGVLMPSKLASGNYTFIYSTGSADCPNEAETTIEIIKGLHIELQTIKDQCEQLINYTPEISTITGAIDSWDWQFVGGQQTSSNVSMPDPIDFLDTGRAMVVVTIAGKCGQAQDTINFDIQSKTEIIIGNAPALLCSGSSPIPLSVNVDKGTWSGAGVDEDGVFDASKVAPNKTHSPTYTVENGVCSSQAQVDIKVVQSKEVTVENETICIESSPIQLKPSEEGGSWEGPGGIDSTGMFDPNKVDTGVYEIIYHFIDSSGCEIEASSQVRVEALPRLILKDTILLCQSDIDVNLIEAFQFDASPAEGQVSFSGDGVKEDQMFNAVGLENRFYPIEVDYTFSACSIAQTVIIELIEAPELSLSEDKEVCISEQFLKLETNLNDGLWVGKGIDTLSGVIDLIEAGGADTAHIYTYIFSKGTNCEQKKSVAIQIIDPGATVNAGQDDAFCEQLATFELPVGQPSNGHWEGDYLKDSLTGILNAAKMPVDTYIYRYVFESELVAGCQAFDEMQLVVHANPITAFEIDGLACVDTTFQLLNNSMGANGYDWDFGNGLTSIETSPIAVYDTLGTYTITLQATSVYNCNSTTSLDLYITTPPEADFTIDENIQEGCAPLNITLNNNSSGDDIQQFWIVGLDTIRGADPGQLLFDEVSTDSVFPIQLVVENFCGVRTANSEILVHPVPLVDFGLSKDEGCSPFTPELANTTIGNPNDFFWDLGNDSTSTDSLPILPAYTTSDTMVTEYTITQIATNDCGADTLRKDLTIFPPNVDAFIEQDTTGGCQPLRIFPISFSTPGAKITWKIVDEAGQEEGSHVLAPEFLLDTSGIHTLILYAENCGIDTDTARYEVLPAPLVNFNHRPFICVGQELFLDNQSVNLSGSEWDFGDSNTSKEFAPTHRYDSAGIYTVRLTGYSQIDACPKTVESIIEVKGNPIASFAPSRTEGCAPLTINFESLSAEQLRHFWHFDDQDAASLERNPSYTFEEPGNYEVILSVFNQDSCFSDTSIVNIFVFDHPKSKFSFEEKQYCLGVDSIKLINESIDAATALWVYDGDTLRTENPVLWPTKVGSSPIELLVENLFGCPSNSQQIIEVLGTPINRIQVSENARCQKTRISFLNNSTFTNQHFWDFKDGNSSTDEEPRHLFLNDGIYEVEYIAANTNGCPSDTSYIPITIWSNPKAAFDLEKADSCGTPTEVFIDNQSQDNLDNTWFFGDGGSSDLTDPVHTYFKPGLYPIQLIVKNENDCADTLQKMVDIFGQPDAKFTPSIQIGCQGIDIQFKNNTTNALGYIWEITDFPNITEESPTITFDQTGSYEVSLTAIYNDQCQDKFTLPLPIQIYQQPLADFYYQADNDPTIIGDVAFFNTSLQANRYLWDLGDNTFSESVELIHEYNINRSIPVTLTAYNDNGGVFTCIDTIQKLVNPEWITTFFAPNAFAPNYATSKVRVFQPVGLGLLEYKISVFSPWGELVWFSNELEEGQPKAAWNGQHYRKGTALPQGAYYWLANLIFESGVPRTEKGTVLLLR